MAKDKIIRVLLIASAAVILNGCGQSGSTSEGGKKVFYSSMINSVDTEEATEEGTESESVGKDDQMYLVTRVNSAKETIQVYSYEDKVEYIYRYGLNTEFHNKYGDHSTVSSFEPGDAVTIDGTDEDGRITDIYQSEKVWTYDDIVRFNTEPEKNSMSIADTKYDLTDETYIFSSNERIGIEDISQEDVLCVVGDGTRILSVSVKTGHGKLKLKNTKLFEGSFLQLSDEIFTEITKDMEINIPEGKYLLTVANNGWGGSTQIAVVRGQTTEVDLDTIKGEGPKKGTVKFVLDPEDAELLIDGKLVSNRAAVSLQYGNHRLEASAKGRRAYQCTLCVNSKESTIMINLTEESSSEVNNKNNNNNSQNNSNARDGNNDSNNKNNSHNSNNSSTNNSSTNNNNTDNRAVAVPPSQVQDKSQNGTTVVDPNGNSGASKSESDVKSALSQMSDDDLKDYLSTISGLMNSISS